MAIWRPLGKIGPGILKQKKDVTWCNSIFGGKMYHNNLSHGLFHFCYVSVIFTLFFSSSLQEWQPRPKSIWNLCREWPNKLNREPAVEQPTSVRYSFIFSPSSRVFRTKRVRLFGHLSLGCAVPFSDRQAEKGTERSIVWL